MGEDSLFIRPMFELGPVQLTSTVITLRNFCLGPKKHC